MSEFSKAQGLQVTRESRHHAQQQLRKMLCLDLYIRLLGKRIQQLSEEKSVINSFIKCISFFIIIYYLLLRAFFPQTLENS